MRRRRLGATRSGWVASGEPVGGAGGVVLLTGDQFVGSTVSAGGTATTMRGGLVSSLVALGRVASF